VSHIILQGGVVVTLGQAGVLSPGTIVVEHGRIVEISPGCPHRGPEVVDCSARVLMPGLCNAHLHSEYLLLKGTLEQLRLDQWEEAPLYDRIWQELEDPLQPELVGPAFRASYLEQALNGVTFVGEFNTAHCSARLSEGILAEVGLRGSASVKPGEPSPNGAAVPILSLHNENSIDRQELQGLAVLRRANPELRLTQHTAETAERQTKVLAQFGSSMVQLLAEYGLLSPKTLLSHAVHVDEADLALLAQHGVFVVASPTAEMKLGDGVAPVVRMLELGIPVCLGTDCATCNNSADLFLEMKTLGLLHKLISGVAVLPAKRLLELATVEGYRAFGISDGGRLEVGARADLTLLDRRSPGLTPLIHLPEQSNVHANLVYGATGRDVTDVMVDGAWVVRGGRHRSLDRDQVYHRLQSAAERVWALAVRR